MPACIAVAAGLKYLDHRIGKKKEVLAMVRIFLLVCVLVLNACAFDLVQVEQVPTQLQTNQDTKKAFVLDKEVRVGLGTGYSRTLKQGTRWAFVGTIPQGDVYKTKDQVLTVEASNIHEAFIVVASGKIIGFYLPVEKTFTPLGEGTELVMKEISLQ
jgi:hypothetical protein